MLQPDMLPLVQACCSRTCLPPPVQAFCSRTCCHLFEHVAARYIATCSSLLQPDMLPPIQAYCSWTCCHLFEHVAARYIATCSSLLQPDMLLHFQACCSWKCCRLFEHVAAWDLLPPVRAYCSLIRTCCSRDRIFSRLFWTWYGNSRCSSGLWEAKMQKCMNIYKKYLLLSPTALKFFGLTAIGHKILALPLTAFKTFKHCLWQHLNLFFRNVHHSTRKYKLAIMSGRNHKKV